VCRPVMARLPFGFDHGTQSCQYLLVQEMDRETMYEDMIRRLVEEDPGRYSGFVIVFNRGNSRSLDACTPSLGDSCYVEGLHFLPSIQIPAAR
jgi:hypothetical protein